MTPIEAEIVLMEGIIQAVLSTAGGSKTVPPASKGKAVVKSTASKPAASKSTAGGSKTVPPASKGKAVVKSTASASKSAQPVASAKKSSKKQKTNEPESEFSFSSDDSISKLDIDSDFEQ
jgi:hypothetical protein